MTAERPLDNVKKHASSLGFQFWYDPNEMKIDTDRDGYCMRFVQTAGVAKIFIILYFDDIAISLSGVGAEPLSMLPRQDENGITVWPIGAIGRHVSIPNPDRSVNARRRIALTSTEHFRSREQQRTALILIEEFLTSFDGSWRATTEAGIGPARVEFSKELLKQIRNGDLIK